MNLDDFLHFILPLGLWGAIITALVLVYRARVQPMHYEADVLLIDTTTSKNLQMTLTDPRGDQHHIHRLFLGTVAIKNASNKDFEQFDFGLTLPPGLTAVEAELKTPDRHHTGEKCKDTALDRHLPLITWDAAGEAFAAALENLSKVEPQGIDFKVRPFNRGDEYIVQLTIVPLIFKEGSFQRVTDILIGAEQINISTPTLGVRLVRKGQWRQWFHSRLGLG